MLLAISSFLIFPANFLTFLSKNQTLDNTIKIDDCKDIQYIIKMNNLKPKWTVKFFLE